MDKDFSGFEMAVIDLLGQDALLGGEISIYETAEMFWKAGRESMQKECAKVCNERADSYLNPPIDGNEFIAGYKEEEARACAERIEALPI